MYKTPTAFLALLAMMCTMSEAICPPCLLPVNRCIPQRDDYAYTEGIGAHKLHLRALPWNQARKTCEEEGGHLAVINSIAEAKLLKDIFSKSASIVGSPHPDFAAIGFHDLYQEGEYVTIHGESLERAGYSVWAGSQPDNAGGNENCGSVHISGGLNDINCGTKFGFFCELPF